MNAEEAPPPEGGGARHETFVRLVLGDMFDAGVNNTGDPAEARRIAINHAYEQLWATLPKGSGL